MPGGKHDDRNPGPRADLTAHVHAERVREPQVQDDQLGTFRRGEVDPFLSGRRLEEPVGHVAQRVLQGAPDRRVVLDDEQRAGADRGHQSVVVGVRHAHNGTGICAARGTPQGTL